MGIFGSDDVHFKNQKYHALRKQAQTSGVLFQDPEFPPSSQSISKNGNLGRNIEWKRPKEICSDPKLVVDGISSQDLIQGELGNCWLVAACCCLAIDKSVWSQVIPDVKDQEWDAKQPEKYAGIFHFRFWRYGVWTDVVIDDLLPCRRGQLVYLRSKAQNEFWSPLLEKAYAKLIGSYEALDGGELSEALEDFTGGVSETFNLQEEKYFQDVNKKEEFFEWLERQLSDHALMAAAIPAVTKDDMEKATDTGLVMGHAYSITAIKKVGMKGTGLFSFLKREKLAMIRLRNPWGGSEWKGAFSDGSEEWSKITSKERSNIGLTFDEDGEFWMTFDDFVTNFINLAVCHMLNLSLFSLQKRWHASTLDGEWSTPNRAGGCINNRESFLENPQFAFSMTDDENEVILVLTQKDTKEKNAERSVIGFTILKVEENRRFRLHTITTVIQSSVFRNSRSVLLRRKLERGRYVVVSCKFDPGQTGAFLMRFFLGCNARALYVSQ
ncbi:hypothetical protein HELRODRAFT_112487 [Helobdella robusta]|uniref:Calpain catalytic domain-containing protein n=1 Tax=Helobdella robusta TaxID=6412 RepID=T1EFK4_HELRO|nr:hypothetical protein HELRODRAFT_112487 [Helobdella robusta]ESO02773.1 hypothetical protein HELRODRAFT_112487 [Helobdella robusta]